jgi:hypothetical protein
MVPEQGFDLLLAENDWQHPVLETIVVEDIGKGRGNDRTDAEVFDRPHGVLPRRTASKISARDEDFGSPIARQIEFERRIERSIRIAAPIVEQKLAESRTFNPFEELLGNDLIGVDVRAIHRGDDADEFLKWLHGQINLS